MADEFIDILDKTGKPTGEIQLKSKAHALGLYHASVHIWLYTKKGEILFQKRADNKNTFPKLWDVSVAGHIAAGESPENSAIREIEEEIGLFATKDKLKFIGTHLAKKIPKTGVFDNEFHHIYLLELTIPIQKLTLQKEEVSDVRLLKMDFLKNIIENPKKIKDFVPHSVAYYKFIFEHLKKQLNDRV